MSQPSAITSASASGSVGADQLDVDLVELAVAALLRPLVAEHRAGVENLLRQGLRQAVGDQRAADAGGAFRPQRDGITAAILERVHLLRHDIGGFARACGRTRAVSSKIGVCPFVEAVERGDAPRGLDHMGVAALHPRRSGRGCRGRVAVLGHDERTSTESGMSAWAFRPRSLAGDAVGTAPPCALRRAGLWRRPQRPSARGLGLHQFDDVLDHVRAARSCGRSCRRNRSCAGRRRRRSGRDRSSAPRPARSPRSR